MSRTSRRRSEGRRDGTHSTVFRPIFNVLIEFGGSLVPCVTAHMLHNGVVLGVLLGVSSAMSV